MIPCPVPIAAVRQAAAEPSTETWLAAKDRPVYVAVARLSPEKDLATLLDAFALLRQQRRARLVVLGEGGERGALERRAHRLGIADDVRLPGWLDNPYPLMQRADAVVVSSRREGFCRVLVEGLALGVPVISTDCPCGPREILDGGRLGTLVPVGDADALARAMHDVAAERAPMPVVGDDELAAYDVEAVTDQFAALFEELVPSASRNSLRSPR
jgi:glycosyltransferase involved in cell wall biosynthesis